MSLTPLFFLFSSLLIEIESLWGQQSKSLDPVALFRLSKISLLAVDLFYYKNREILLGVVFEYKMTVYWFIQPLMSNMQSVTIHSYTVYILCFSNILVFTPFTFDHIDYIGCLTICRDLNWILFPSNQAFEPFHHFNVVTGLTVYLLALEISLVRQVLFWFKHGPY